MPSHRFVILTHDHPHWHWDAMFESGAGPDAGLRTWRVEGVPDSTLPLPATPLPDHRLTYLDYEGPVSGNRGVVQRWDQGTYRMLTSTAECFEVEVAGKKLNGRIRISADEAGECRYEFTRGYLYLIMPLARDR